MLDDTELLRAYAERRSEEAFAELVRRHLDLVYSAALRRVGGDTHLAEDVSQKVFISLARQASSLTSHPVLTGWLYTASRYAAAQVVRTERRRQAREQEAHMMNELDSNPARDPEWNRVRPVLDELMDRLDERDRAALLLRFFEGKPFAELSRKLNLTEDAARKRVERALEKLRVRLAARGVASTGAAVAAMLANQTVAAAPTGFATAVTSSALASGLVAAGPLVNFLQLMSTSKIVAGTAGIALLLAVGIATHERYVRRDAEAAFAAANRDYEDLISKRRELEQLAHTADLELVRLRKTMEDARATEAAAQARAALAAQAAKEAAAWNPAAEGKAFLVRHPEVRRALIDYQNAKLDFKYGAFYKSRGLTPDQIEQFRALMRETLFQPWNFGLSNKSLLLGTGTNMPSAEMETHLRELLGEEGMREMANVSQTSAAREFTVKIAANLHFTDTPLTQTQSDALVKIIGSHRSKKSASGDRLVDWDAASADARGVLQESQLPALEAVRTADTLNQAMAGPAMKR